MKKFLVALLVLFVSTASNAQVLLVDFNGRNWNDPSDPTVTTYRGPSYLDPSIVNPVWNGLEFWGTEPEAPHAGADPSIIHSVYFTSYDPENPPADPNALHWSDGTEATGISISFSGLGVGMGSADYWNPWEERSVLGGDAQWIYADYVITPPYNTNILIDGLTPSQAYDLAIYGCNGDAGIGGYFTANGVGPLDLIGGHKNAGILYGVVADENGQITVDVSEGPNVGIATYSGLELREAVAQPVDTAYLTGFCITRCDEAGSMITSERYNTLWPNPAWEAVFYPGAYDPNTFDPNLLVNSYADMDIRIPFQVGDTKTFTFVFARTGATDSPYYSATLFFNNKELVPGGGTPGITVMAAMDDNGPADGNPAFMANSHTNTMGWPFDPAVPGTGTLVYYDYQNQVSINVTGFVVYNQFVYNKDYIYRSDWANPASGPDTWVDAIGQITLAATEYLPTCAEQNVYAPEDFNQDCYVNLEDFAQFAGAWLTCNEPRNPVCE
ncbi:MAG: hypothetical protein BWY71_00570 [Planctomycetes bacterium ADurb.Bin412]|nr:MAG: hypothetical protein BWY71_00570 [Planctomycetes bacterium ADurb.Bin412]